MKIHRVAAFSDNYIWMIDVDGQAIVVDPGEYQPVADYLSAHSLTLGAILLTHYHDDHTGGVRELIAHFGEVAIYGPSEVQSLATTIVQEDDTFELFGQTFTVLKTAGHTAEHISFLMNQTALFCGDALFSGGCGRVFTGDYQAQYDALQKFKALNDDVKVYAGHEYTLTNLRFLHREFENDTAIAHYLAQVTQLCQNNQATLPSTIGLERQINRFMTADSLAEFINLRTLRDQFK